jgi:hypothetical protein
MEDKTPAYLMIIVGIVAIVGIVVMITASSRMPAPNTQEFDVQNDEAMMQDDALTGYVAYDTSGVALNAFGKIFFVLFLAGIAAYMYYRHE